MNKINDHTCLNDNEIALFLDTALTETEKARVVAHLRRCDRCRSLCTDDARLVTAWRAGDFDRFQAPAPNEIARRRETTGPGPAFRYFRPVLAGAVVVAVAAAIWLGWFWGIGGSRLADDVSGPILAAVETASRNGLVVLPGGENNLDPLPSVYRSVDASAVQSLETALEYLHGVYEIGDADEEIMYWLIAGYLSQGRHALARVIAEEASRSFPKDSRIRLLYGLAKHADGDTAGAEAELRRAAAFDPEDPVVLVNFGLVLMDGNKTGEGAAVLERLIDSDPDAPVGRRARAILETSRYR